MLNRLLLLLVAAAYAVGRTGCWAVGDDYGRPWNGPWATVFPHGAPPSTAGNLSHLFGIKFPPGTPDSQLIAVHPTQLYEVTLGFIMFVILWRLRDHRHAEGWLFGLYCVLAGLERFIIVGYGCTFAGISPRRRPGYTPKPRGQVG